MSDVPKALSIGVIAERVGAHLHQIRHIINSRGIKPLMVAGHAHVYSEADVLFIESELKRIAREREALCA